MTPEQVEEILSPYYGALTQTAIDHIAEQIVDLADREEQELLESQD